MSTPVDKFNFLFTEFLDKIITRFPDTKLSTYKRGFLLLKRTSPTTPINLFMAGCVEYKTQIKNRDELFFINSADVKKSVSNFTTDFGINELWSGFTDATKTAIWDYIQSLFVLGEMIIEANPAEFLKYKNLYSGDYKDEISELRGGNFSFEFLSKINS